MRVFVKEPSEVKIILGSLFDKQIFTLSEGSFKLLNFISTLNGFIAEFHSGKLYQIQISLLYKLQV